MALDSASIENPVWKVLIPHPVMERAFEYLADNIANYIRSSDKPVKLAVVTTGGVYVGMRVDMTLVSKYPELITKYSYHVVDINSYGGDTKAGYLDMRLDRMGDVDGCNVVIIDDIFDTGNTVNFLVPYLIHCRGASDIKIAMMLLKEGKKGKNVVVDPDWYAIRVIDVFVAGCGLDGGANFSYTRSYPDVRYNVEKHPEMPEEPWYFPQWKEAA